jgi:hypothetical protein
LYRSIKKDPDSEPSKSGSIQDRINAIRSEQKGPRKVYPAEPQADFNPPSSPVDEELLQDYISRLQSKMKHSPSAAELLHERTIQIQKLQMIPGGNSPHPAPRQPQHAATNDPDSEHSLPVEGAILCFSTGEIAIFDRDMPSKNYQIVYMLNGDGTLSPKGIYLQGHEYDEIGALPPAQMNIIESSLSWNRDVIVYHLSRFEDTYLIPNPSVSSALPPAAISEASEASNDDAPSPEIRMNKVSVEKRLDQAQPSARPRPNGFVRGQRFKISFGAAKEWDAVYWGRDQQGTVIAHKTSGNWTLMHLDLKRFKDAIAKLDVMSTSEVEELGKQLSEGRS